MPSIQTFIYVSFKNCSDLDFLATLYSIFKIEFFALYYWKEREETVLLTG